MVRSAEKRKAKFEHKVDAEVLASQMKALKPLMVSGQAEYFPKIVTLEDRIKKLVEAKGETSLKIRDYLNYGRELYKLTQKFTRTTLNAEAQLRVIKWSERGLSGETLLEVASLFGLSPSAVPTPTVTLPKWLPRPLHFADGEYWEGGYELDQLDFKLETKSRVMVFYHFPVVYGSQPLTFDLGFFIDLEQRGVASFNSQPPTYIITPVSLLAFSENPLDVGDHTLNLFLDQASEVLVLAWTSGMICINPQEE